MDVGIGIVIRLIPDKIQTSTDSIATHVTVLITQRKPDAFYPGYWEFPGGKANPGEVIEDCVVRELAEEVGIGVEVFGVFSDVVHAYPHALVRIHPRVCRLEAGSPEPRNLQVADHRWVQPNELASYRFPEANECIVRELLEAISRGLIP